MQPISPEEARRELERRRAMREQGPATEITPDQARAELSRREVARAAMDDMQLESVTNPSAMRGGIQASTPLGAIGEQAGDILVSGATSAERGLIAAPQIAPAAVNLGARAFNASANLFRDEPRQYEPPAITREQWLNAAFDMGVLSPAGATYEPQTPAGRIVGMGAGGAAEGLGFGAGISLGRRTVSAARGGPAGRGLVQGTREDVAGETLAGFAGGASGAAGFELTGDPVLATIFGVGGGLGGARTMFASTRADEMIRERVSDLADIEPGAFDQARRIQNAAARLNPPVFVSAPEAISLAARGGEANELAALAGQILNRSRGGRELASAITRRSQEGGEIEQAFRSQIDNILQGEELQGLDEAAAALVSVSRDLVRNARRARTDSAQQYLDQMMVQRVDEGFAQSIDEALAESISTIESPNSVVRGAVSELRNQLVKADGSFISNVDELDEWFRTYNAAVSAGNLNSTVKERRLAARVNRIVRGYDSALDELSQPRRQYNQEFARFSEEVVNPLERAIGGIANEAERTSARSAVQSLLGYSPSRPIEDVGRIRSGFRYIVDADPEVAAQVLAAHIDDVFSSNMRDAVDARRSIAAPAQFRRALYGTANSRSTINALMNQMDVARGMRPGTTFDAFENFMLASAATGQIPGTSSRIARAGNVGAEAETPRGFSGAAASVGENLVIAPTRGLARIWQQATAQNTYNQIARAFLRPDAIDQIEELAGLSPRAPRALTLGGTIVGGRQFPISQPSESDDESDGNQ